MKNTEVKKSRVKVTVGAKKEYVEEKKGVLYVRVRAKAKEGAANVAVCEAIARHYNVSVQSVHIISGVHSRGKMVCIYANNS